MITTPTRILSPFITLSLRKSASSGGVSVGSEEGEGGGASAVKWGEGGSSRAKWCDGAHPSGSVVAGSNPVSCGGVGSISDVPELEG
jgi:hypothetical protein